MTGFPSAGQPTGLSGLPFLILLDHQGFRPLGRATKGAAFGICQPFEKGWTENFLLPTLRGLLSGGRGFTRGIWPQDMLYASYRTSSCGEPLDRVPLGRTAHWAVRPSLPDLVGSSGISPSAEGEEGALPLPSPPAFFKRLDRKLNFADGQVVQNPRAAQIVAAQPVARLI